VSREGTFVGSMPATVVKDLTDNLISFQHFVNGGSIVVLNNDEGLIWNSVNSKTIPLYRDGLSWRCYLDSIVAYDYLTDAPNDLSHWRDHTEEVKCQRAELERKLIHELERKKKQCVQFAEPLPTAKEVYDERRRLLKARSCQVTYLGFQPGLSTKPSSSNYDNHN
jgi:hypothetical protein